MTTWITQALCYGSAVMTLRGPRTDAPNFEARMTWPHGPVIAAHGGTPDEALKNLETNLTEDCAQEMIDKGAV